MIHEEFIISSIHKEPYDVFHWNYFSMFATCFVQPLDLVKNRMQVCVVSDRSRPSSASVLMGVVKNEGFRTLYTGLSAGLLRQATYTTTRLGKHSSGWISLLRIQNIKIV